MTLLWSAVQFVLGCLVCLAFTQLLAAFLLLPPLYSVGQVLWLVCFILPLLGVTLLGTPTDSDVMKKPLGKNQIVFNVEVRKKSPFQTNLKKKIIIIVGPNFCVMVLRIKILACGVYNFDLIRWDFV